MNLHSEIIEAFCSNVESFAAGQDLITHEILPICERPGSNDVKEVIGRLYFRSFNFDFVYIVNNSILGIGPKSILECRIWLSKGEKLLHFSLYDLMYLIDSINFKCYFFPYIENAKRMNICFAAITNDLNSFIPKIAAIAEDLSAVEQAYICLKTDIASVWDKELLVSNPSADKESAEISKEDSIERYYSWLRFRFASRGYSAFLSSNYKKAIKVYSKYKKRLAYEDRLLEFMKSLQGHKYYNAVLPELNTLKDGLKAETGTSESFPLFVSWAVITPFTLVIYLIIYYVGFYLLNLGAVYSTGIELYNAMFAFLPAFLTSIVLSYSFRRAIFRLFFRKSYQRRLDYDAILNTKSEDRFMKVFSKFVISGCLLFTMLFANTNISFHKDGLEDSTSMFSIKGKYYGYEQIESVWLVSGRYNSFNQWLDNPSYVIQLKSGKLIDLYQYLEFPDMERHVLPIFQENGFEIQHVIDVDSIK
jgi:hypothetical protein